MKRPYRKELLEKFKSWREMFRLEACILVVLVSAETGFSQTGLRKIEYGMFFMTGNSRGVNPSSSTINNQVDEYVNGFVQFGGYAFWRLRSDSAASGINFLKVDLGSASRGGTFDIGGGSLARLTQTSIDLSLLVPVAFNVTQQVDAYAGFGGVMSYRYNTSVTTASALAVNAGLIPGFLVELGFKLGGSAIGYRTMIDFQKYQTRVGAIFFAFSPMSVKKRKRSF